MCGSTDWTRDVDLTTALRVACCTWNVTLWPTYLSLVSFEQTFYNIADVSRCINMTDTTLVNFSQAYYLFYSDALQSILTVFRLSAESIIIGSFRTFLVFALSLFLWSLPFRPLTASLIHIITSLMMMMMMISSHLSIHPCQCCGGHRYRHLTFVVSRYPRTHLNAAQTVKDWRCHLASKIKRRVQFA